MYMLNLSKHPYDWIIHLLGCAGTIYFGCPIWIAILFWIYIEYEQKQSIWYNRLSWKEYFIYHSLGDLIADAIGIILGSLLV